MVTRARLSSTEFEAFSLITSPALAYPLLLPPSLLLFSVDTSEKHLQDNPEAIPHLRQAWAGDGHFKTLDV